MRALLEAMVTSAIETGGLEVRRLSPHLMRIGKACGPELVVRVAADLVIVSVDASDGMEIDLADDRERAQFAALLAAFGNGELEARVGSRDGKWYAIRGGAFDYEFPAGLFSSITSGERIWRPVK
ncbi:hypothetical protein [Actinokineospora sp. HUAS TT18]|uniref:hypothetical protein n=1 Tax=Actinokineospora sp. HUAS TT18 TaxID=3447451 RepID=UPI003F521F37